MRAHFCIFITIALMITPAFAAEGSTVTIRNHLGEEVSLSAEDIASAISGLSEGQYTADEITGGNADGSVNIKKPKISYEGNMYRVAGTPDNAKGVCSLFGFKKYHAFKEDGALWCRDAGFLKEDGGFNGTDGHYCHGLITVVTCSDPE